MTKKYKTARGFLDAAVKEISHREWMAHGFDAPKKSHEQIIDDTHRWQAAALNDLLSKIGVVGSVSKDNLKGDLESLLANPEISTLQLVMLTDAVKWVRNYVIFLGARGAPPRDAA
jgi:hypothetical protein